MPLFPGMLVQFLTHWKTPFEQWLGNSEMYSILYRSHMESLKLIIESISLRKKLTVYQLQGKIDEVISEIQWPGYFITTPQYCSLG